MQNIVVESEEDAKKSIEYLKEIKGGRATFLPITTVESKELDDIKNASKCNGFIGVASDLIKYDKKFDSIMKNLLCRVVVADNIDNAIIMARQFSYKFKIVTINGEVLNPGGSITGGSLNKTTGFLSRANQIKTLSEEISKLTVESKQILKKNETICEEISSLDALLKDYQPLLREYENEILVAKNTLEHLNNVLKNSDTSEKLLNEELEHIEQQLTISADEVAKLVSVSRVLEKNIVALNSSIAEKEEEYNSISSEKEERAQRLLDETLNLKTLENGILSDKKDISDLENSIVEFEKDLLLKQNDKNVLAQNNVNLVARIEEKNKEIEEIKTISDKIKLEIEEIENEKLAIVEGLKGITDSNKDLTDRLLTLQQEFLKAEAKQAKYEQDSENIINRLWDEYELTKTSAEEIRSEIEDISQAKERVSDLKGKLKVLGHVNLDAIDEYIATKERFDFLSEQKTDLENSQDNLNKVIVSMQELMEEHFEKQFARINKAFSRVFNELFGGGNGRLYLSDPDDIMESGIEIEVQLPGKGLQNINLYSGGEKSFIAIALLFAILEVKPTPFCFLDEIDAALDDVNVARFSTYLKNYLNSSQFIVITHRRGTMEASNIMYGVTMQEKGVSKLLSLKIDEVEDEMLK